MRKGLECVVILLMEITTINWGHRGSDWSRTRLSMLRAPSHLPRPDDLGPTTLQDSPGEMVLLMMLHLFKTDRTLAL